MSNDIILPTHMRNKKVEKLTKYKDKADKFEKALKGAQKYINSIEIFLLNHGSPEKMSETELKFMDALAAKHASEVSDVSLDS